MDAFFDPGRLYLRAGKQSAIDGGPATVPAPPALAARTTPELRPQLAPQVPEYDLAIATRATPCPLDVETPAIVPPVQPALPVRYSGLSNTVDAEIPLAAGNATSLPLPNRLAPPAGLPVANWAAETLGFHADPIQAEILNTHTPRLILCCTRQWGKSSVAAVKALHLAAAKPGAFILIASASYKQSAELLRVIRRHAEKLTGARCKGDGINRGAIVLPNESRILALPQSPDTVRCFAAVDVIVIDEAAFVAGEMHNALSPMLATTNGQLWLLSSANSTSGEFYKIWRGNGPEWRRFKVTAPECPRISPEFLSAERAAKGEAVFNREYMCDFTAIAAKGVPENVVDDAFRGDVPAVKLPTN